MKARMLTTILGIPFLIFVLIVRGWLAELLIVGLTLIALYEVYHALEAAGYKVSRLGGFFAALAMWPAARFGGILDPLVVLLAAMAVTSTDVLLRKKPEFPDLAMSVYPLMTCLMPLSMFMMLLNAQYGEIQGITLIVMAFAIGFMADGMAYLGGRKFGKHKLSPLVSPNKTVEGSVCGFAGAVVGAIICRFVLGSMFGLAVPGIAATIALAIFGSAAGQLGDLMASLLKRYCSLKDYGNLFPGHGGVMDRFDGMICVLMVIYFYTLMI